jgi:H+-transporting ATPase
MERTDPPLPGLSSDAAGALLKSVGPNAMPDTSVNPLRMALGKFWSPVPWMLEAAIILQVVMGDYVESGIIGLLLVFNACLGYFQEGKAQATLAALKSRLAMTASVRRDGAWKNLAAAELVPGDIVKLSLGGVVAADVRLISGEVLLDQSMLTGESIPIEAGEGFQTYAGALVRRGEAVAQVTDTGIRTKFGKTAELVRTAYVVSTQQKAVLRVVRNLAMFNGVLIIIMILYAHAHAMPPRQIVLLGLTAILASIPVALPATFTLAAALGARDLAHQGVLPTRLSAVDEAATVDVLCVDKTGTLTRNALKVSVVRAMPGFDDAHVLAMAAMASSDGGQDPVDAAVHTAASAAPVTDAPKLIKFVPFDPATKMSEATGTDAHGNSLQVVKGAFSVVIKMTEPPKAAQAIADELEGQGLRVLAVAAGFPSALKLAGFIALGDPPRDDAKSLLSELNTLGVRTVMITGDSPATAAVVARAVGLTGPICPPGPIPDNVKPETFAVFAGVLPEDKFSLVKAFQKLGHTVGMCGDGANDAPALRQAQMGIAVSTATDVAKSAAGIVLTEPGLAGIVASVKEGRITFQRILTYTMNSVRSKIVQVLFIMTGLFLTGHAILTPMLMIIVMLTGDFLGMSMASDNVRPSTQPNAWRIGKLTLAGIILGLAELIFCLAMLIAGKYYLALTPPALQTLVFITLVFGNEAALYTIRSRRRLWSRPHPARWVIIASLADLLIAAALATFGILMTPIPFHIVAATIAAAVAASFFIDAVKVLVINRMQIA